MNTADINTNLIESYFELLKNLNPESKLELIARLSDSIKAAKLQNKTSLKSLYGAFISDQSAEEIITDIKKSRNFSRKRAEL